MKVKAMAVKAGKADLFLMWPLFIMRCPLILPLPSRPFALLTSLNHPQVKMIKLMTHFPIPTVVDSVATFEFVYICSDSAGREFHFIIFLDVVFGSDASSRLFQKVEKHIFISFCIFILICISMAASDLSRFHWR